MNNPKTFNSEEIFVDKIWVTVKIDIIKIMNDSIEKSLKADVITKNHTENPNDTAIALNLDDEKSILYRIN